jgi:hypothetical protein
MFDKARRKSARPKDREDLLWTSETFAGLVRPLSKQWPKVRDQVGPVLQAGGEKLGDLYASVAQVVARRKEAFEDRLAERKAHRQRSANAASDSAHAHKPAESESTTRPDGTRE